MTVHSQLRMNQSKIGRRIRPVRSSIYNEQLEQAAYEGDRGGLTYGQQHRVCASARPSSFQLHILDLLGPGNHPASTNMFFGE